MKNTRKKSKVHQKVRVLDARENVSNLFIQQCHIRYADCGRSATLKEFKSSGYWITSCNTAVRSLFFKCVKYCGPWHKSREQKMANFPVHRLAHTVVSICLTNSWSSNAETKSNVTEPCLRVRAVYIEITHSLDTDSFMEALRWVINRSGNIAPR